MSQSTQLSPSEHRRAVVFARFVYAFILLSFIGVCAFAVIFTMNEEKSRSGFKAIKVTAPISFMDRTYMDEEKGNQAKETP
jgi:nucleoside recognition membrane protein YjiH